MNMKYLLIMTILLIVSCGGGGYTDSANKVYDYSVYDDYEEYNGYNYYVDPNVYTDYNRATGNNTYSTYSGYTGSGYTGYSGSYSGFTGYSGYSDYGYTTPSSKYDYGHVVITPSGVYNCISGEYATICY